MSSSKQEEDNNQHAPLNPLGTEEGVVLVAQQKKNSVILWGILAALLVLAGAVFFVLPGFVSPPSLTPRETPRSSPIVSNEENSAISPFEEAQRLRQREGAQAILAELLASQETLELKGITQWADAPYRAALTLAAEGDTHYREQAFVEAQNTYQQVLEQLQALERSLPATLTSLLEEGESALSDGDSVRATNAYELALTVDANSGDAVNGLERARVLDQVIELVDAAKAATEEGRLDNAREQYQAALSLDLLFVEASQGLADTEQAIITQNFTAQMSQGYAALQSDNFEQAEAFFLEALRIKPNASDAHTALEQVRDQVSSNAIKQHLNEAEQYSFNEEWSSALGAYNAALLVDPNVIAAQNGLARAQSRLNLDNFLQALLADPLGLMDEAMYDRSLQIYAEALRIPDGGSRLIEQMNQSKLYLEQARVPVSISLRSDNMTNVRILRANALGTFTQQSLALVPGRYVASGSRLGYQDVRVEFSVPFTSDSSTPVSINVICTNPI